MPLERWAWPAAQRQTAVTEHSNSSLEAEPSPRERFQHTGQENGQGAAGNSFLSLLTASGRDILQQAKVQFINNQLCNSSEWLDGYIYDFNVCAGQGGVGTCQVGACYSPPVPAVWAAPSHHPSTAQHLLSLASCSPSPSSAPPLELLPPFPSVGPCSVRYRCQPWNIQAQGRQKDLPYRPPSWSQGSQGCAGPTT